MNMTKEIRRELRVVKRKLKRTEGECSRSISACLKAQRRADKSLKDGINTAKRLHAKETKEIERERRVAVKLADRTSRTMIDRIATLEGRLS